MLPQASMALSHPRSILLKSSASLLSMSTDSHALRQQSGGFLWPILDGSSVPILPFTTSSRTTMSTTTTTSTTLRTAATSTTTTTTQCRGSFHHYHEFSSSSNGSPLTGFGSSIHLTPDERELFALLRRVVQQQGQSTTTLRVAGGWVRDKLLATPEFRAYHKVFAVGDGDSKRLTSKYRQRRQQQHSSASSSSSSSSSISLPYAADSTVPVDIDIALDDMLGREFADLFNHYLSAQGEATVSVGMMMKNPAKSKHLETATMRVNNFWLDFVNLRAEEYAKDSRIPDVMRIGTAREDAFRRDLTINSLFFNINTGQIEDWTGRGFSDLRKGVIATPLPALTTFLDDPLRVLRAIRFAARLRFSMSDELVQAAKNKDVVDSLEQKVSRERIGGELDRMLRTPDPVGAVRLLCNLGLVLSVFPIVRHYEEKLLESVKGGTEEHRLHIASIRERLKVVAQSVFERGLRLLATSHDHLADCQWSPPLWCRKTCEADSLLIHDEEARRLLWYAAFVKPLSDDFSSLYRRKGGKKSKRSVAYQVLVDDVKRPGRDVEAIEKIIAAANDWGELIGSGADVSATMILLSGVKVIKRGDDGWACFMNGRSVNCCEEDDPLWEHAMEFRLTCANILRRIGPLWRASMVLAIAEDLNDENPDLEYCIEGDVMDESRQERRLGVLERFDTVAAALLSLGLKGVWDEKPLADGQRVKQMLEKIPKGPAFRDVMDEQIRWTTLNPGASESSLERHLVARFPDFSS